MTPNPLPTNVVLHDARTDELRSDAEWTVVFDDGSLGTLRLRVARGFVEDRARTERRMALANPTISGGL
jgi:hypothetical protein